MYVRRIPQGCVALCVCLAALGPLSGCGELGVYLPPAPEVPAEIAAVVENRDSARVAVDDPLYAAPAGSVIDGLSGLDGCWASYVRHEEPMEYPGEPLPAADGLPETLTFDNYELYRFDFETGAMTWVAYGEISGWPLAQLMLYEGTFTVSGESRLTFRVERMLFSDPVTGQRIAYPEDFLAMLEEQEMDEEAEAAVLADMEESMRWEYLVTLDGDQVKLVPVWDGDGVEVVSDEDASVCVRFACPE